MPLLQRVARAVPPSLVSYLGRAQFAAPAIGWLGALLTRRLRHGQTVIARGLGAGLRFDPDGGNPGYSLGTSGIEEQRAIAEHLHAGSVFYDVGANKGFYAVIGARLVGPTGTVYAIEPEARNARAAEKNATLNRFHNLHVLEVALSDQNESAPLLLEGDSIEHRLSSSLIAGAARGETSAMVQVRRLDDLIRDDGLAPPDFILMDVEGAEVAALRGATETIRAHRPTILVEVHWIRDEFLTLLEDVFLPLGYRASQLDGRPLPDGIERYHALLVADRTDEVEDAPARSTAEDVAHS